MLKGLSEGTVPGVRCTGTWSRYVTFTIHKSVIKTLRLTPLLFNATVGCAAGS